MADSNSPPAPGGGGGSGLSGLYASLLNPDPSAPGTISRAPVLNKLAAGGNADADAEAKNAQSTAQRFAPRFTQQPKRPAPAVGTKAKPKMAFPKTLGSSSVGTARTDQPSLSPAADGGASSLGQPQQGARAPTTTRLEDWAGDDDDVNDFYGADEKRQRGGRKKRKKRHDKAAAEVVVNWDDNYDSGQPTDYLKFPRSDEKYAEQGDWNETLHVKSRAHRTQSTGLKPSRMAAIAPPPELMGTPANDIESVQFTVSSPPPPPTDVPDDPTGEDAYARRMRMSMNPRPPPEDEFAPPPPPSPPSESLPMSSAVPSSTPAVISRAPVRCNLPAAPTDMPETEEELAEELATDPENLPESGVEGEDQPRSRRPGQSGFAQRLMEKHGWTKGQGLGARGTGIINPLMVKKRKDVEGRAKIVGGQKSKHALAEEEGKFGKMSPVVVLRGMLDGMSIEEMADEGLLQDIGEECSEKYGRVERVKIHFESQAESVPVFVKFTAELSALKAVNALEGRMFGGNTVRARFFDLEAFEKGHYE
ncbi:hypothetical protein BDY21DRAFT_332661 [Lineolata rhizophorae]|uniref:G-patch domain-containing protein n=1 Tax=Lineolata rhizophorae TaxID=578093 RepID=A0A6A6PCN5_9PEZI|nr:hypothetical protein BDY21DRAFT_332661 [Lineolata rhizophorae]